MNKNSRILALLFFGVLIGALDISIVGPAIPSIEKTIGMNERDVSWIFSIYVLFNLVGISLMARLSDVFGRKWIYMIALFIFGTGSLIVSLSDNISVLLVGRAIQGFGSSGIFPVAAAVIGDVIPVEKRGRALGLLGAVFGLAFLLGPFIAGFVLLYFTWNSLFLINIPIVVILIIFSNFLLSSRRVDDLKRFDWEGIILLAAVLTCFTIIVNSIDARDMIESLFSWPILPLFVLMCILIPILLMLEKLQSEPIINLKLIAGRQTRLVGFIAFGIGLFQSSMVFMPKMMVALFNISPSQASFMLAPVVIATAIGAPLSGRLVDKIGSRKIIATGLLLSSVALFLFSFLVKNPIYIYISGALLGCGLSIRASLSYIMLNEVSERERAATQGLLIIFISIGQLTGSALFGTLTQSFGKGLNGFGYAYLSMAGLALILGVSSFFLKNRKRELENINQQSNKI